MTSGRPGRPVRSVARCRDVEIEMFRFLRKLRASRPSASDVANAPNLPFLMNVPRRRSSADGMGLVRISIFASGTGFPSGPTTCSSNSPTSFARASSALDFGFVSSGDAVLLGAIAGSESPRLIAGAAGAAARVSSPNRALPLPRSGAPALPPEGEQRSANPRQTTGGVIHQSTS